MKTYTLIGGVNGAGKSSLSGVLQAERRDLGVFVNVDEIVAREHISNIEAGKLALVLIKQYMNKGIDFTQETTLSGVKTLQNIRRAKRRGYMIRLYYVGLETAEDCITRIKMRAENGGHYIEEADVVRRFNKRYESLMRILPYCDEANFYDNCNGFIEVGKIVDGQMIFKGSKTPNWLIELTRRIQKAKEENIM